MNNIYIYIYGYGNNFQYQFYNNICYYYSIDIDQFNNYNLIEINQ